MKQFVLNLPDSLNLEERELQMMVASMLYEQGKLSLGEASKLVGLSKKRFAELLGNYNVSLFNYPASELASDVKNA